MSHVQDPLQRPSRVALRWGCPLLLAALAATVVAVPSLWTWLAHATTPPGMGAGVLLAVLGVMGCVYIWAQVAVGPKEPVIDRTEEADGE